jgi:DNA invertase Pin-like site-specific DNA recombinase
MSSKQFTAGIKKSFTAGKSNKRRIALFRVSSKEQNFEMQETMIGNNLSDIDEKIKFKGSAFNSSKAIDIIKSFFNEENKTLEIIISNIDRISRRISHFEDLRFWLRQKNYNLYIFWNDRKYDFHNDNDFAEMRRFVQIGEDESLAKSMRQKLWLSKKPKTITPVPKKKLLKRSCGNLPQDEYEKVFIINASFVEDIKGNLIPADILAKKYKRLGLTRLSTNAIMRVRRIYRQPSGECYYGLDQETGLNIIIPKIEEIEDFHWSWYKKYIPSKEVLFNIAKEIPNYNLVYNPSPGLANMNMLEAALPSMVTPEDSVASAPAQDILNKEKSKQEKIEILNNIFSQGLIDNENFIKLIQDIIKQ